MLTQERLKELLSYDPDTEEFRWRVTRGGTARAGSVAGYARPDGYIKIKIDGKFYLAHRLAWLYVHREFVPEIDHINGVLSDNRIANLRPATHSQNLGNGRKHSDNTSGFKGVHWDKRRKKWRAVIGHNSCQIHLGRFDTIEEAHAAYCDKARELFGEFARTS